MTSLKRVQIPRIVSAAIVAVLVLMLETGTVSRADVLRAATTTYRASATASGNSYAPVLSRDGSSIAFVGHANNMATNDDSGPYLDLFVRDLAQRHTSLVSVSTNGLGGANDDVRAAVLSANGQVIAFETSAGNLAAGDANGIADIYVRDRAAGTTRLVSVAMDGVGAGNGRSFNPLISADGRYVVFESEASNLVANDFNGTNDVFVRDIPSGVTLLVSVDSGGTRSADGPSHSVSISDDGLSIAFVSHATNLVEGVTNRLGEVYVWSSGTAPMRWVAASHIASTWTRGPASGQPVSYRAFDPVMSSEGRYVAFKTETATVRFDLHRPVTSIFEQQLTNGFPRSVFSFEDNPRVSRGATTVPLHFASGGRLLFLEAPANPNPAAPSGMGGIVRVDFDTLLTNWISIPCGGCQGGGYMTNVYPFSELILTNRPVSSVSWSRMNWLASSPDGTSVYFQANVTNSVLGGTTFYGTRQIYGFDSITRNVQLVSTNRSGVAGPDLLDVIPSVNSTVSRVAWDTLDSNLTADDLNQAWDVFVRELADGATTLVSTPASVLPRALSSSLALGPVSLSADGSKVAFASSDSALVANDTNRLYDIFVRSLEKAASPVSSLLLPPVPNLGGRNGLDMADTPMLSADGRYLAFARTSGFFLSTNRSIYWADLSVPTNRLISSQAWEGHLNSAPVISADGRFVAYSSFSSPGVPDANGGSDVFLVATHSVPVEFPGGGPSVCVSTVPEGTLTANGFSVEPVFSPDANWLMFRSSAKDLVQPPLNPPLNTLDYHLFARRHGCTDTGCLTNMVSTGLLGPTRWISYHVVEEEGLMRNVPLAGGGNSATWSGDSRWVAFASGGGDVYRHDLRAGLATEVVFKNGRFVTNQYWPPNDRVCTGCSAPSLNDDGNVVAYESRLGGVTNVYCRNLLTDAEELISVNREGTTGGNGRSFGPILSQNGRFVVFVSQASDLVSNDENRALDVFVRDRWNHVTHSLSAGPSGSTGNRVSSKPVLSADGRTVAFQSFAGDLAPGDYNDTRDVIVATLAGPDTDGDGMDDELELAYFNTLEREGSGDFDDDGVSDRVEIQSGTNPANGNSVFGVLAISSGVVQVDGLLSRATYLAWRATPGRRYRVEQRTNLGVGAEAWSELPGEIVTQGPTGSFVHTTPINPQVTRGFYRVKQVN